LRAVTGVLRRRWKLAAILLLLLGALGLALLDRSEWGQTRKCLDGVDEAYQSVPASRRESVSYEAFRETSERLCEELAERGLYDEDPFDPAVRAEVNGILAANPDILAPSCISAQLREFERSWPGEPSARLRTSARHFADRYCDIAAREGYISLDGYPSEEESARVLSGHPEVFAPLCVESGMEEYEPGVLIVRGEPVSRRSFEALLERIAKRPSAPAFSSGQVKI
jgi:hypothetical protein